MAFRAGFQRFVSKLAHWVVNKKIGMLNLYLKNTNAHMRNSIFEKIVDDNYYLIIIYILLDYGNYDIQIGK